MVLPSSPSSCCRVRLRIPAFQTSFAIIVYNVPDKISISNYNDGEYNNDDDDDNNNNNCTRQEEPAILISQFFLRVRRMYVPSIRLDFH